ncbi:MAG: sigma-E factor negative regulatory protein, partial [Burkholderiales bacterium]
MERISALMDGELDDHEVVGELQRLKDDPDLRAAWETYHAIGDTLRGHGVVSTGFAAAVKHRLKSEATVLAPRRRPRLTRVARVALPVAASMCGVALVAWLALYNDTFQPGKPAPVARAPQPQTAQAIVPAAAGVNEYLLAHQQFSPRTDIQGVAS